MLPGGRIADSWCMYESRSLSVPHRNARVWGVSEAAPGQKPVIVTGRMAGKRDPGYWETSRMLLESGLCLALQV